jgi:hypothetical protein
VTATTRPRSVWCPASAKSPDRPHHTRKRVSMLPLHRRIAEISRVTFPAPHSHKAKR